LSSIAMPRAGDRIQGAHLLNAQTQETARVGSQWEASNNGRRLFTLAKADHQDRDASQQIAAKIAGT